MSETNGINPVGSLIYDVVALFISSILVCVYVIWEFIRYRKRKIYK